jgi:hypothetical protein
MAALAELVGQPRQQNLISVERLGRVSGQLRARLGQRWHEIPCEQTDDLPFADAAQAPEAR